MPSGFAEDVRVGPNAPSLVTPKSPCLATVGGNNPMVDVWGNLEKPVSSRLVLNDELPNAELPNEELPKLPKLSSGLAIANPLGSKNVMGLFPT